MADGISIKIMGYEELAEKLSALEPKLSKKILRRAFKDIGGLLVSAAQAHAPVKSGMLKESIVAKVSVGKKKVSVTVGAKSGGGFYKGDQFYLAFNELGTRHQPARPFLRPALANNDGRVIQMLGQSIAEGIDALASEAP